MMAELMVKNTITMASILTHADTLLTLMSYFISSVPSIEPSSYENLIHPWHNKAIAEALIMTENHTRSQDELTWGIVKSNTASVYLPCSYYKEVYSRNTEQFLIFHHRCYSATVIKSIINLMLCAYKDSTSRPLTWSTVTSV